jgi:hypothetical protein
LGKPTQATVAGKFRHLSEKRPFDSDLLKKRRKKRMHFQKNGEVNILFSSPQRLWEIVSLRFRGKNMGKKPVFRKLKKISFFPNSASKANQLFGRK